MEPKKVKKLVLNKEIVANLNAQAMSRIKGGDCMSAGCPGSDYFCTGMANCSYPPITDTTDPIPLTPPCLPGSNTGYTPIITGDQGWCCEPKSFQNTCVIYTCLPESFANSNCYC